VGTERIDLEATAARNIMVTNTPGANAASVAELAITLLAAAARDIVPNDAMVRAGRFKERHGNRYKQELTGARLGVVGAGRIGRRVSEIARGGFACEIGFYDPYVDVEAVAYLSPNIAATIGELCEWADHIVVAAPVTPETAMLIGLNELTLLGPNGIVVVSSRGGIIDEAALAEALEQGLIHGAALDVYEPEPPLRDNPLFAHSQIVLSPHMGGHTAKTRDRMFTEVCQQTWSLLNGGEAILVGSEPWRVK
jgi:phosphoglycerate dehydrogenase-like enzyme